MQLEETLSLLADLSRLLGGELTKNQAAEFFVAVLKSHLNSRGALVLVFNQRGDPVPFPPDGESNADGCDVPMHVIENSMATREIHVAGANIVLPLKIEPKAFGAIVLEGVKDVPDKRLMETVACMASGLLCCGRPPQV